MGDILKGLRKKEEWGEGNPFTSLLSRSNKREHSNALDCLRTAYTNGYSKKHFHDLWKHVTCYPKPSRKNEAANKLMAREIFLPFIELIKKYNLPLPERFPSPFVSCTTSAWHGLTYALGGKSSIDLPVYCTDEDKLCMVDTREVLNSYRLGHILVIQTPEKPSFIVQTQGTSIDARIKGEEEIVFGVRIPASAKVTDLPVDIFTPSECLKKLSKPVAEHYRKIRWAQAKEGKDASLRLLARDTFYAEVSNPHDLPKKPITSPDAHFEKMTRKISELFLSADSELA